MSSYLRFAPLTALLATAGIASTASAQPATQPPPPPEAPAEVEAQATVDQGVIDDVNADRAWMSPTALTQPKGSWSFNDYELLGVGMTYGVTDSFQISATTLVPITSDMPTVLWVGGKGQFYNSGNLRVAGHAVLFHASEDDDSASALTLGVATTLCLDSACHSTLNGYAGTAIALTDDDTETPILLAGSIVKKFGKRVKFVGEIDTGLIAGEDFENDYFGWYGLRFTSGSIGADVGFVKPFGDDFSDDDGELPIGLPWINFTYREL